MLYRWLYIIGLSCVSLGYCMTLLKGKRYDNQQKNLYSSFYINFHAMIGYFCLGELSLILICKMLFKITIAIIAIYIKL